MKKIIFDELPKELEKVYDCAGTPIEVGDVALLAVGTNTFAKVEIVKLCKKTITVKHPKDVLPNGIRHSWEDSLWYVDYYSKEWQRNVMPRALYILDKK